MSQSRHNLSRLPNFCQLPIPYSAYSPQRVVPSSVTGLNWDPPTCTIRCLLSASNVSRIGWCFDHGAIPGQWGSGCWNPSSSWLKPHKISFWESNSNLDKGISSCGSGKLHQISSWSFCSYDATWRLESSSVDLGRLSNAAMHQQTWCMSINTNACIV